MERAGGLTSHSYLYASQLTRVSTRQAEEEQLRLSIAQMQREFVSRSAAAPPLNAAGGTEQVQVQLAAQQAQLAAQQAAIAQLSSVHPTGRIVLDIKPSARNLADIPNFKLEDGDSFYIPSKLNTVQVMGEVYNDNAFEYWHGKRVSAYLKAAGGPKAMCINKYFT